MNLYGNMPLIEPLGIQRGESRVRDFVIAIVHFRLGFRRNGAEIRTTKRTTFYKQQDSLFYKG